MERTASRWVAGYLDHGDYLLFSISRDGFESFLIQNGNKIQHGSLVPLHNLKQLAVAGWNDVLEDLNRGPFGFKDQLTVYSFQFAVRN